MRRASSNASSGSLSTPVISHTWNSSQRRVSLPGHLYPRAQAVLAKLRKLPRFEMYEIAVTKPADELPQHLQDSLGVTPPDKELDPVSLIRRLLKVGAPLTLAFNEACPNSPLEVMTVEDCFDLRQVKKAIYRFCEACLQELKLKIDQDLFTISQIFNDGTGELLRPLKTLELLLDPANRISQNSDQLAVNSSGTDPDDSTLNPSLVSSTLPNSAKQPSTVQLQDSVLPQKSTSSVITQSPSYSQGPLPSASASLSSTEPTTPQDQRSKVIDELLQTERKYVQDLELLLIFHDEMLNIGIPRDTVQKICPRLPKLVDFQRRFLVGCEYQVRQFSGPDQNLGWLFLHLRSGFEIYKPYTLGQREATQTAIAETNALMPLSHILEPMYELPATLLKPVQRILRYPLLLKEILKNTPPNWPHYNELQDALDAMHAMMCDVNETQRRAENASITLNLQDRIKDWKNLDIKAMGELLLSGTFPVVSSQETEQEYSLYLFERVLLFCRDRVQYKKTPLTKMRSGGSRNSQGKSLSLELRGRVYLNYLTSVSTAKSPTAGYLLKLGWGHRNDASESGSLNIRLANDELSQMWESTIQRLASVSQGRNRSDSIASLSFSSRNSQTSLNQVGKWTTTNVGSIDEDYGNSTARGPRHSSASTGATSNTSQDSSSSGTGGAVQFWDDSPTSNSPVDGMRKLSVSSMSSQQSLSITPNSSNQGSRTSLSLNHQQQLQLQQQQLQLQQTTPTALHHYRLARPVSKAVDSNSGINANGQRTVRIHIQGDAFLIIVTRDIHFETLASRVERKLKLCGKMLPTEPLSNLKFEYTDEDDDRVRLESDEDLLLAFEAVPDHHELSIYVTN